MNMNKRLTPAELEAEKQGLRFVRWSFTIAAAAFALLVFWPSHW